MGQQVIKCKVVECLHWAHGDNCDLQEIWVQRKPNMGGGLTSALGMSEAADEQDTFCASFDQKH